MPLCLEVQRVLAQHGVGAPWLVADANEENNTPVEPVVNEPVVDEPGAASTTFPSALGTAAAPDDDDDIATIMAMIRPGTERERLRDEKREARKSRRNKQLSAST